MFVLSLFILSGRLLVKTRLRLWVEEHDMLYDSLICIAIGRLR